MTTHQSDRALCHSAGDQTQMWEKQGLMGRGTQRYQKLSRQTHMASTVAGDLAGLSIESSRPGLSFLPWLLGIPTCVFLCHSPTGTAFCRLFKFYLAFKTVKDSLSPGKLPISQALPLSVSMFPVVFAFVGRSPVPPPMAPGNQKRPVSKGGTVWDWAWGDVGSVSGQALGLPRPQCPTGKMGCWNSDL